MQDFLIEALVSIREPSIIRQEMPTDYTLEDVIEFAKQWEGLVDILQLRVSGGMANHPSGWNSEKNKNYSLQFAQAIKESGVKIKVSPNGGFQNLDFNEECIATGKCDMIAMGHAFICDWEYGKKACEGRGEDVVPCIRCDICHGRSALEEWISVCAVNPRLGLTTTVRLIDAPSKTKKVAIIGGGPAGMKAAITTAERGHRVTLYEKNDFLGGQLHHVDFIPQEWPLKDFRDYLTRQLKKVGVEVHLRTEATPEMIKEKRYDAVLVALGAEPIIPKIPGANGRNVWNVINVYGHEKEFGKNVAYIGGGQFGMETAIYLAQSGHKLTLLSSMKQAVQPTGPHQLSDLIDYYQHMDNLSCITHVTTSDISEGKVTYKDAKDSEKSI